MRTLTAKQLREQREQDEDLLLINVLDTDAYEKEHIPDSHNIPLSRDDFLHQVQDLAARMDRRIVVHCSSKDCKLSPTAAKKLEGVGFTNVADFEGGMAEWKLAGFETESGAPVHASS
jgi:rhodanese-related sulfurtransferase